MQEFQYPVGPVPLVLAFTAAWVITQSFRQRQQLNIAGFLLCLSACAFCFATSVFFTPPSWPMIVSSQVAAAALTLGAIHLFNKRSNPDRTVALFASDLTRWKTMLLTGALAIVVTGYVAAELVPTSCNRRCQIVSLFLGRNHEFLAMYMAAIFGGLGVIMIAASLVGATKRFRSQ